MALFSRTKLAEGFTVDPDAVRETARRQLLFSAVIMAAALKIIGSIAFRAIMEPRYPMRPQEAIVNKDGASTPVRASVHYVDRSSPGDHRLAFGPAAPGGFTVLRR
jgi:hypothetical protein